MTIEGIEDFFEGGYRHLAAGDEQQQEGEEVGEEEVNDEEAEDFFDGEVIDIYEGHEQQQQGEEVGEEEGEEEVNDERHDYDNLSLRGLANRMQYEYGWARPAESEIRAFDQWVRSRPRTTGNLEIGPFPVLIFP